MNTKYRISYKNKDGSHHSSETLTADELIIKLIEQVKYEKYVDHKKTLMPTSDFEVEKRTVIGST